MQCKFCTEDLCSYCLLPEVHKCKRQAVVEKQAHERLVKALFANRVVPTKIISIE